MMTITFKKNTTIISSNHQDFDSFFDDFQEKASTFLNENVILDLSHLQNVTLKNIGAFSVNSKAFKKQKKSFLIVVSRIDFNKVPNSINVVPSLQEAFDVIEMEEIERDLGF
jgi:uncharacterized protein YueI